MIPQYSDSFADSVTLIDFDNIGKGVEVFDIATFLQRDFEKQFQCKYNQTYPICY